MSLQSRVARFDEISKRFKCERLAKLILIKQIEPELFHTFQIAAMLYFSRSLPGRKTILREGELLASLIKNRDLIKNMTPNGVFVPKLEMIPEFNLLYRTYVEIIQNLNIQDLIDQVGVTVNFRLKEKSSSSQNLGRSYPTELIHSDAWVNEKSHGIEFIIPMFGDTEKNYIECYDPPENFEESWLKPLPNFKAGAEISTRYIKTGVKMNRRGYIYIFDYAVLHQTVIEPGAGPRISTNHAVFPHIPAEETQQVKLEQQKISYPEFASIGREKLLIFPESLDDEVSPKPMPFWQFLDIHAQK